MNTLENHLIKAVEQLTIKKEDREPYTKMYDTVRDWLFAKMCEVDPVFKQLYKGTCLFGSYSNDVRIRKPDEFDCIFVLQIPFGIGLHGLKVKGESKGYYGINLTKQFRRAKNSEVIYNKIRNDFLDKGELNRVKLQDWLETVINGVFAKYGKTIEDFELEYEKRATAHNIYVKETKHPYKKISIDFVCGLHVHNKTEYIPGKMSVTSIYDIYRWYLVPKASKFTEYSFMLTSPEFENVMLWNKQNLKNACRLLKALRDHYELNGIKSYFIITCFLHEIEKRPEIYWFQPLNVIFLNTLKRLLIFLNNKNMPYFWIKKTNLLGDVNKATIENYRQVLTQVHKQFETLNSSKGLCSYQTVAKHFETIEKA